MAAIRDWTFNYTTATTGTTIGATLPTYEENDLLLAILSTDTGTTQQWSELDPVGYYYQYSTSGGFVNETTAANNTTTGDTHITGATAAVNDAGYWGSDNQFNAIGFLVSTAPSVSQTWVHEYWNGGSWTTLTTLYTGIATNMATGTRETVFDPPGNWAKTDPGNGVNAYWVRVRVSAYTSQTTRPLGTQAYIGSSWSRLFTVSNTNNLAVMYRIAGASETDPTFAFSIAETANIHLLSIRDVNTTSPFNGTGGAGTGYITANNSAAVASLPQLTTTVNDSLVLYICSESGTVVPGVLQGPVTFEDAADGSAHSEGFSWGFMHATGATPSSVKCNKSGTAAGVLATVGISPPSGGATIIPPYCADDASIYVDPIHGVTAYNSNTAFAATYTTSFSTTLNGKTAANGTAAAAADVGINSFHSMGQLTGTTTAGTWSGARLAITAANKPNVTGKNVLVHVKPSTPKIYQNTDPLSKVGVKGVAFGMSSTANTNYRVWHVHGAGTLWDTAQHVPLVINDGNITGRIQNTGTLNPSSIESFGFAVSGFLVAPVFQFGSLWVLDTTIISGGNAAEPVGVVGINKICSSGKERMSVLQQGAAQILVLQPIQIGDGGTNPVYLDLNGTAIEFPEQYDVDAKNVFYCSVDNVAGLTYYAGASDYIYHRNSVVSSKSRYKWGLHASTSTSAHYDFSGLSVIGAGTITLAKAIHIAGLTINDYSTLDMTGLDFDAGTILNVPAGNDTITTSGATLIENSTIDVTGVTAGNRWCSVASPVIFENNTFTGSASTGHAIRITTAGTYTFVGNVFNSFGVNGSTSAAIYNDSGGSITLNITGGGNTPTYRNGTNASTTINNAVTLKIVVVDSDTAPIALAQTAIYQSSDGTQLMNQDTETVTAGDFVIGIKYKIITVGTTDFTAIGASSNTAGVVFTATGAGSGTGTATDGTATSSFNYVTDTDIYIRVRKSSAGDTKYYPASTTGTVTSTGFSTTITLIEDTTA